MKRACFIIPYYGKFPDYFPLWLNSAKDNPEYDFYFLTDISWNAPLPPNVIFVRMTLEEITQRVRKMLKIEAPLHDAYKLCDLKPAYGFLFPEVVSSYPFWGYIDIDMVFGKLSLFLTDEIYGKYDKMFVETVNQDKIYWDWYKRKWKIMVQSVRDGAIKHRLHQ